MLILLKSLVPKLTAISGHARSDGIDVAPYMAVRHVLAPEPSSSSDPPPPDAAPEAPTSVVEKPAAPADFSALLAEMAALPPPPDPEVQAIEDRLDLADAMADDPHSDRTKRLLEIMAVKELDRIAENTPAVRTMFAAATLSSALAEEELAERLRAIFLNGCGLTGGGQCVS